jgi:hypothetical protein
MSQKTVTINGTTYDAHTGLPVKSADTTTPIVPEVKQSVKAQAIRPSQSVHHSQQKSQTLNRRVVKSTASTKQAPAVVKKSPAITKFAPHPAGIAQPKRTTPDVAPVAHHPIVAKTLHRTATAPKRLASPMAPKPSQVIKQEAIAEALDKAPHHSSNKHTKEVRQPRRFQRVAGIGSISLALLLLGGYFTYLNMPSLSVRVAAAQAGVNATYPDYRPDGYSLSGAVAYTDGEVNMKFASNSGPQNFTLNQKKSSWDSSAVLDNYVKQKAGENYITYNERGLTIYTYGSDAAWINNGVLYTINGDAPLSSDQIRHIATSM